MDFVDGSGCTGDPARAVHIQNAKLKAPPTALLRGGDGGEFLQAASREQGLRHHQFDADSSTSDARVAREQPKHDLAQSLGLLKSEEGLSMEEGTESAGKNNWHHSPEAYADVLEKLDRITRHEDAGNQWINIKLDPVSAYHEDRAPGNTWITDGVNDGVPGSGISMHGDTFAMSALQISSVEAQENGATSKTAALENSASTPAEKSHKGSADLSAEDSSSHATSGPVDFVTMPGGTAFSKAVREFQVIEENNELDSESFVTVVYNFPLQTMESRQIAFIVVALPPQYTAREDGPLCHSLDSSMPPLKCSTRSAYMRNRPGSLSTFVTLSSSQSGRSLPLGRHSFRLAVRTPSEALSIENPSNWWFSTFRFTGGHAITKHWENRKLISKRDCIWGEWRQETPCSTTCGGGFEVWTRTLFSGESEEACGGALMKRRCQVEECSLNCQLSEWETMADCTKSCGATNEDAFKIRIRKVLVHKRGWGQACAEMHPWDPELGVGWSEKMQAVVSISPCDDKFKEHCPAVLGCRVEESNTRTIPDVFPWGACPFPCGGFGRITSIVQVANGIPRWIGEQHFPESFQIPCRADTEPLVTTRSCNTDACEDCSVYIENPIFGRATRAWFFFLPTAEADHMEITAPRGVGIVDDTFASTSSSPPGTRPPFKVSALSSVLPPAAHLAKALPELTPEAEVLTDAEELGTCARMATSFGAIASCAVSRSRHYSGSQAAHLHLASLIEPSIAATGTPGEKSKKARPQWFALPVLLGKREEMEDAGNFYLWLTRSKYPNDPEVFKCHLRTKLALPKRCKFAYTPKNPEDCKRCTSESTPSIETWRRFLPSANGGSCEIPHALRHPRETLVQTSCVKSCSQLRSRNTTAPSEAKTEERHAHASPHAETHAETHTGESLNMPSSLRRLSRRELQSLLLRKKKEAAAQKTSSSGRKADVEEGAFSAVLLPVDDVSMPLLGGARLYLRDAQEAAEQLTEVASQNEPESASKKAADGSSTRNTQPASTADLEKRESGKETAAQGGTVPATQAASGDSSAAGAEQQNAAERTGAGVEAHKEESSDKKEREESS
ncbi:uncharacterized protein LOC34621048, partial [Cyclospora cayetanensis]|uniref:Uncharacterized protein LOC34621048 n=1 Tax=Cyclospora cayetanensis TaxID=88456 RepID=A0A6P6RRW3_9EIME